MNLLQKIERAERWQRASDELARRSMEYAQLSEAASDDVAAYRWAKRALRAVRASMRCMNRSALAIAAMTTDEGGAA